MRAFLKLDSLSGEKWRAALLSGAVIGDPAKRFRLRIGSRTTAECSGDCVGGAE
jgi:hypothetical protein